MAVGVRWPLWCTTLVLLATTGEGLRTLLPVGDTDVSRTNLTDEEVKGSMPVFIDAFLDSSGTSVYIILLTKPLKGKRKNDFFFADWKCYWGDSHSYLHMEKLSMVQGHAMPSLPSWCDDCHLNSLAINCALPEGGMSGELRLSLDGSRQGTPCYSRKGMTVRRQSSFASSETALCTMMIENARVTPYLPEWVRYHLRMGFDQIIVYIEDRDVNWARRLLKKSLAGGQVRLVHFNFGAISDRHDFTMQEAQEQHCLYHAKGRVSWLGHSDADEYFQVMGVHDGKDMRKSAVREPIKTFLRSFKGTDLAAVSVRSQFWFMESRAAAESATSLPCDMTCKDPGYLGAERRKLIMDTERVRYYSIHTATRGTGSIYTPDPDSELRLNHFKAIGLNHFKAIGYEVGRWQHCQRDLSFQEYCREMVDGGAALP